MTDKWPRVQLEPWKPSAVPPKTRRELQAKLAQIAQFNVETRDRISAAAAGETLSAHRKARHLGAERQKARDALMDVFRARPRRR